MEEKRKIELLYKFLHKRITKEEYEEFVNEFGKKDIHNDFDYLFDAYAEMISKRNVQTQTSKEISGEADRILKFAKQKERISQQKQNKFFYSPLFRVAAVVLVVISVTLFWNSEKRKGTGEMLTVENTTMLEKSTAYGEFSNVTLSDGSNVKLNAGSKILFNENFSGNKRNVSLNGQAFFDVARNENKPFVINTGNLQVTVLGTSFDVKAFNEDDFACITVVRGKVRVNSPEEEYILTPNEQAYFQKSTGKLIKKEVNAEDFVKWTNGTLYFNQTPVKEMVRQIERWYNVKIEVADPELLYKTVTGEYINEKLTAILNTLEFSLHVKYEIEGDKIILNKSF